MDAGDLDLGLLRTFLTLVRLGSLGKTAASIDKTHKQLCCADRVGSRDAALSGFSSGHGVAGGNGSTC
jgi:hypothetical protein